MAFMANDIFIDGSSTDTISRIDGFILLSFFSIFMAYTFALAKSSGPLMEVTAKEMSVLKAIVFITIGLVGLFFGGKFLVDGAVDIARSLGISEAVIGLTVVAAGTSMPELATSVVAAFKKKSDIAIGNVVGSNIFNVFFVLGISASIRPIPLNENNSSNFDMIFLTIMSVLMFVFIFLGKDRKINRLEGAFFFLAFVAYTLVLILDTERAFPFR
jgi:cation:H+ antiporter